MLEIIIIMILINNMLLAILFLVFILPLIIVVGVISAYAIGACILEFKGWRKKKNAPLV